MGIIAVEQLKRDYQTSTGIFKRSEKTVSALKGISFEVQPGEIFGLLGPNGAGKTTTIKILTTLLAPTSGSAQVLGYHCFGEERSLRQRINFILGGERNLYWRLSAWDNLSYFCDLYNLPEAIKKKRITELLDMVGLLDKAHYKVESFSKGMKQRLQIARGLVNDPEVLFLDEPTIGLDPAGARTLRDIIRKLANQGKTIVLTTHYMHEADELCDRIAIINKGELVTLDTPSNLKKNLHGALICLKLKHWDATLQNNLSLHTLVQPENITASPSDDSSHFDVEIQCTNAGATIASIIATLPANTLISMSMRETTLEDVYLSMIEEA